MATAFVSTRPNSRLRIPPVPTVQTSLFPQKADLAFGIASNQTDNDGFLLSPLETVDAAQLNAGEPLLQGRQ
jgi:hypothetical protein